MTEDAFRKLALSLPDTEERSHMGHPDFRVGGKIFASLGAQGAGVGTVKFTPDQQDMFGKIAPDTFTPAAGAWGRQGWTKVILAKAKTKITRDALMTARHNVATSVKGRGKGSR